MNKRENKGISLIALVITIIVLLILAGISIATLLGDDGLLNKANEAKNKTSEAEAEEWDKTATSEDCFIWGSDIEGEERYNTIVGYKEKLAKNPKVRIPSRAHVIDVSELPSDEAAGRSFLNEILEIELPSTLTEIGDFAFGGCNNGLRTVKKITIPDSVTSIGDRAFYECDSLTEITIPDSVTSIGSGAFYDTSFYYNLPDGEIYINKVFYKYKGEMQENATINIKEGTISISAGAFMWCDSLTEITIPDSVTSIGDDAFSNCSSLTEITIPDSVTSIGDGAFNDCTSLTEITIPDSVTSIGDYAFHNCDSLTEITIPDSVTSIGDGAFSICDSLTEITIPDSVTSIGNPAFSYCDSLTEIKCRVSSKPNGWNANWNSSCNATVTWGYTGE